MFADHYFGVSPLETSLKFFERVREISLLNSLMKLVQMRREDG